MAIEEDDSLMFLKLDKIFKRIKFKDETSVVHNGLKLQEVGDFEALNCLPPQNLIRSTKLHLIPTLRETANFL